MILIKMTIKVTIHHHGKAVIVGAGEIESVTHKAMGDIYLLLRI